VRLRFGMRVLDFMVFVGFSSVITARLDLEQYAMVSLVFK